MLNIELNNIKIPAFILIVVLFIVLIIGTCQVKERKIYIKQLKAESIHGILMDSVKQSRPLQKILVKNENDSIKEYYINLKIPFLLKNDSIAKKPNSDSMNFYRKINGENTLIFTWIVKPF